MQTSEVLNRAADLIEERGWRQHDWSKDGLCLEGGIIAYPAPGAPGWATTRVGSQRFAAWLPVGVEA